MNTLVRISEPSVASLRGCSRSIGITVHDDRNPQFEAYIDSGSPNCYFHASIGEAIGVPIKAGFRSSLGGIVRSPLQDVFFHEISIHVAGSIIRVEAGFTDQLSVAGILGRKGFFDNYIITFDHTSEIPAFEIRKINRA
jgi:hypothetical protein